MNTQRKEPRPHGMWTHCDDLKPDAGRCVTVFAWGPREIPYVDGAYIDSGGVWPLQYPWNDANPGGPQKLWFAPEWWMPNITERIVALDSTMKPCD
jgi:hypothetical protein